MDSRAYTEVNCIINKMPEEMKNKIPVDIIKNIQEKMDKTYEFFIEDIETDELLEDTEKILSVLYADYLATEEERKIIRQNEIIIENKKREGNPNLKLNELFTRASKSKINEEGAKEIICVKKEKWYTKIVSFFTSMFRKK